MNVLILIYKKEFYHVICFISDRDSSGDHCCRYVRCSRADNSGWPGDHHSGSFCRRLVTHYVDSHIRGHQLLPVVAVSPEEIMKIVILSVLTIMLMMTLASCGQDEYRRGAADAVRQMQIQAEQSKQKLMGKIQPTLLFGAIMVLLLTFYGDVIAEKLREKLVAELGLTPARQAMLLTAGYLLICSVLAGWSMARCGIAWAMPVLLLITGATAVFFSDYLPSLFQTAKEPRRLALSRIKLLVFAVCVILAVHELLASDGILRLPLQASTFQQHHTSVPTLRKEQHDIKTQRRRQPDC